MRGERSPRPVLRRIGPSCRWGGRPASLSSFPSEHAAVAAAASTVLAYLFPKEPAEALTALADEAATRGCWRDAPSAVISRPGRRSVAPSASARWPGAKRTARTRPGMAGSAHRCRLLATDPTRLFPAAGSNRWPGPGGPGCWPAAISTGRRRPRRISPLPGRPSSRLSRKPWPGAPPSRKRPSGSGPAARERSPRPDSGSRSPAT